MSVNRALCIFMSIMHSVLLVDAMYLVSDYFSNVQGYEKFYSLPFFEMLGYMLIAVFPSFFLPIKRSVSSVVIWVVYLSHVMSGIIVVPLVVDGGGGDCFVCFIYSIELYRYLFMLKWTFAENIEYQG